MNLRIICGRQTAPAVGTEGLKPHSLLSSSCFRCVRKLRQAAATDSHCFTAEEKVSTTGHHCAHSTLQGTSFTYFI